MMRTRQRSGRCSLPRAACIVLLSLLRLTDRLLRLSPPCRRTNQLGSTVPSTLRKRQAAQQRCSGEAGVAAPAAKQPRCVA